ncbi:MAG: ATP-binding protein [Archangium sp.]|nr:ATP-binding protein [Archangium sp.]MDP3574541.1 ATP-binding protein [Archangium sp.]
MSADDSTLASEHLAVLRRATGLLATSTKLQSTLESTIEACLPSVGDFGFFDLRVDDDLVVRTALAYEDPRIADILRPTQWVRSESRDLNLCALSTGEAGFHANIDDAWYQKIAVNEGHLEVLRSLAFCSMLTVPMRFAGELLGALTLFFGRSGRHYTAADQAFVEELANLVVPFVVNARLVERQRRTEEALRQSEERLRLAIDAGKLGIWDWNIVTNHVVWSDRVYELHGVERGQFGGRVEDFGSLVHVDDRAAVTAAIQAALDHGDSYEVEFRVPIGSGVRWLSTRANVIRDADGRPQRMVGATSDVTDRVEGLAAERAARDRLQVLARTGELLAGSLDRETTLGAITSAIAPALADWCRIDLVDDDGNLQHATSHHENADLARRGSELARTYRVPATTPGSVAWVAASGKPYTALFDERAFDGMPSSAMITFVIESRLRSVLSVPLIARGRSLGVLTALRDDRRPRQLSAEDIPLFTELAGRAALALDNARLYAEAERARTEAEAANLAKDEFLAILGHELRNPLAPIVSALHLMDARDRGSLRRERDVIERQVAHLSRLVDDLLDVSRIVRGKVEISSDSVVMQTVLDKAVEMTRPLFSQRGVELVLEPAVEPLRVSGDGIRLAQVVGNLLTNAAKFSKPRDVVTVTLRRRDRMVELSVRDQGMGISPQLLPNVFGLFVQGPQSIDRERGGLGLGLAIVSNLVRLHGGQVTAASPGLHRGATFTVLLPASAEQALEPAPSSRALPHRNAGRILLVDDNVDAGELLADLLRESGYEVAVATSSASAIEAAAQLVPDVAILDIGLPGMDGYELARQFRARSQFAHVRLIALTGYGLASDRMKSSAAGFDHHFVKPVMPDELLGALVSLVAAGGDRGSAGATSVWGGSDGAG